MEEQDILILQFEEMLATYKRELEKNPNSHFYKCLVKNTEEYLEELKEKI